MRFLSAPASCDVMDGSAVRPQQPASEEFAAAADRNTNTNIKANTNTYKNKYKYKTSPSSKLGDACSQNLGLFQPEENDHRK